MSSKSINIIIAIVCVMVGMLLQYCLAKRKRLKKGEKEDVLSIQVADISGENKPIQENTRQASSDDRKSPIETVKDITYILGGATGAIIAIMWLVGRSYLSGYFSVLNIPFDLLNFSVWEHANQGLDVVALSWIIILLLVSAELIVVSFAFVSVRSIYGCIIERNAKTTERKEIKQPVKFLKDVLEVHPWTTKLIGTTFFSIVLIFPFWTILTIANSNGKTKGDTIHNFNQAIWVYSNKPLPIGTPTEYASKTLDGNSLFGYSDLRLITYNDGKYYVFREIDYCGKPIVFVINASDLVQVNLGSKTAYNPPKSTTPLPCSNSTPPPSP